MVRKILDWPWLRDHTNELIEATKEISKIEPNIFYPASPWAALKLISLMLYLNFYTKVMAKQKWCKGIFYIDLLADSGINKIDGDLIAGSPIIASKFQYNPFNKLFLVERKGDYTKALDIRMKKLNINFEIYQNDCNEEIDNIIRDIPFSSHCLVFIDCEGVEIKWDTIEKLLKIQCDIIFVFQTQEIRRIWGRTRISDSEKELLNSFYGDNSWKVAKYGKDLLEIYKKKIEKYNKLTKTVNVESKKGGFHYHLIFITRKTRGGSPWFESVVGDIKKRIERNTGKTMTTVLNVLSGRMKNLEMFFK